MQQSEPQLLSRTDALVRRAILWDNHTCMPLRPGDESFLHHLERYRRAGVCFVSLNVYFDLHPPETALLMLATFRRWIARHSEDYVLVTTSQEIEHARALGKLTVGFDIEGGRAVE